ncbi:MAG: hypothetical protein ACE5HI_18155, partial [bacterium]
MTNCIAVTGSKPSFIDLRTTPSIWPCLYHGVRSVKYVEEYRAEYFGVKLLSQTAKSLMSRNLL